MRIRLLIIIYCCLFSCVCSYRHDVLACCLLCLYVVVLYACLFLLLLVVFVPICMFVCFTFSAVLHIHAAVLADGPGDLNT